MKFVFNGYTYDDNFVQKLNNNCHQVQAHNFNNYLNSARYGGISPIEQLKNIRKNAEDFKKFNNEKSLNISQVDVIKDFYKQFSPELSQKVNSILDEQNSDYKVEIITDPTDKRKNNSHVCPSKDNKHLEIQIGLDGTLEGLRVFAHEISHALSGRNQKNNRIKQTK